MNKDLLIEVSVPVLPTEDDKANVGTGYPVSPDLMLTALHVVAPPDRDVSRRIRVRWPAQLDSGSAEAGWMQLEEDDAEAIVWRGRDDLDAALVRVSRPPGALSYGRLAADRVRDWMRCVTAGFPKSSVVQERSGIANFLGWACSTMSNAPTFEVDVTEGPDLKKGWGGVSGMPIFVGNLIFGIAKHVSPSEGNRRIHVTPTARMLRDEEFCRHLSLDAAAKRFLEFEVELRDLLGSSALARERLASAITRHGARSGSLDRHRSNAAEDLASKLLHLDIDTVMQVLGDACDACESEAKKQQDETRSAEFKRASETVAAVGHRLVPLLFDFSLVKCAKDQLDMGSLDLVETPAAVETAAELLMAAVDRREARFRPRENLLDMPTGELAFPAAPEGGRNQSLAAELDGYLSRKLLVGEIEGFRGTVDKYLKAITTTRGPEPTAKDDAEARSVIAGRLERLRRMKKGRHYLIFRIPDGETERTALLQMVSDLRNDYPAVACIGLRNDARSVEGDEARFQPYCLLVPCRVET